MNKIEILENKWNIKFHLFFIWFCLITLALFNLEDINMKVIGSFKSPSSVDDIFTSIDWVKLAMLTISLQCWSVSLIWKSYCQTILVSGKLRDTCSGFYFTELNFHICLGICVSHGYIFWLAWLEMSSPCNLWEDSFCPAITQLLFAGSKSLAFSTALKLFHSCDGIAVTDLEIPCQSLFLRFWWNLISPGTVVEKVVEIAVGWVGAGFQGLLLLACPGSPDHYDDSDYDHEGDDDNNYISGGGGIIMMTMVIHLDILTVGSLATRWDKQGLLQSFTAC